MDREAIARLGIQGGLRANVAASFAEAVDTDKTVRAPATTGAITLDSADADLFIIGPLTGNITIDIPRQAAPGREINLVIQQGATVRTVSWSAVFRKAADGTATANSKGATSFVWDGAHWVQRGGALSWV